MRTPILMTAMMALMTSLAFADEVKLDNVRSLSDDHLYSLAETLSAEDETRLYQEARKEFPEGALGLQSTIDKRDKSRTELKACRAALENGEPSEVRALNELESAMYFNLLRIVSVPTAETMDMTVDERTAAAKEAGRETNRLLREFRECKREYRKRFGDG